ncbi:MAG: signal recognition particle protein [Acidobacteria bacterium]|nr:signal recognition particle protein [Acidobacteriota bacterium]
MFDALSQKIQDAFRSITGKGKISEDNIQDALKEIRIALLEADVNFKVVKDFIARVKEAAVGQEITKGLNAAQQLVKIVNDQLVDMLGGEFQELNFSGNPPHVIMMVGLQGAGKTTSCGKLARILAAEGRHPLLVPCDVYRPAAILQLETVGSQVGVPVFDAKGINSPVLIVKQALKEARNTGRDTLIIDTAGRLHIDDALMNELKELKALVSPKEILFVADAMTGQDAVQSAGAFHESLALTGLVLTKMDGDARGGAALSVKSVTGCPIKFVGTGEKLDQFERFFPDRMASRILGMGDVLSLVERVQEKVDQEEALKLQQKMLKNQFTLDDFSKSLEQIGKLGDLNSLMGMMPGMSKVKQKIDVNKETSQLKWMRAMISSMTPDERDNHAILTSKRKQRIAKGSGRSVEEINQMLKQFMQMKQMMSLMTKPGKLGKLRQLFGRAGLGDFAKSMFPGNSPKLPEGVDEARLMELLQQNDGKLTPEAMRELGMAGPTASADGNRKARPKKDRKKQKAKRKQGRRKR